MPILIPSRASLIGFIVAPSLFLLSAYFTHATRRHILGAVIGAGIYSIINYIWDRTAAASGWWAYPARTESGQFPLIGYLLAGIVVVEHLVSLDGVSFGAGIEKDLLDSCCSVRCMPLSTIMVDRNCSRVVAQ